MKLHRMLLGCTALLVALSAAGAWADQAAFSAKVKATSGLIGYWPFEGSLADVTSNVNNGKIHGDAAAITFAPGIKGGQALHIENPASGGNFVEVLAPIGSIFDAPKFSVVTFAELEKIADPTSGDWNDVMERNSLWYLSFEPVDDLGGSLGSRFVVRIYDPSDPTNGGTPQIKDDLFFTRTNVWHAYAFTYDGAKVVMYMDGKKVLEDDYDGGVGPTAETPKNSPHNNYNLSFGAWQQRGDWFTGSIDDSAYFNRVLTADEIKGLYDAMMQ
jgi:Concanavalin A-like lectin/glucanases superfamily